MPHPLTRYRHRFSPPMTQAALGRLLGVSRGHINKIETGDRKVSLELLPTVALRTGIPPHVIRPDLAGVLRRIRDIAAEAS